MTNGPKAEVQLLELLYVMQTLLCFCLGLVCAHVLARLVGYHSITAFDFSNHGLPFVGVKWTDTAPTVLGDFSPRA